MLNASAGTDPASAKGTRLTIHRKLRLFAAFALAGALFAGVAATPAEAGLMDSQGRIGSYSVAPVNCRHKIFGATQQLQIWAPAPRVVAANRRAGAGNDAQWVRYAVLLRDYRTHRAVAVTNWSGFVSANDNRVSTWNGGTSWTVNALGGRMYRLDYLIEWYSGNTKVGVAAHYANNVHYFSHSNVKYTGLAACWRYR